MANGLGKYVSWHLFCEDMRDRKFPFTDEFPKKMVSNVDVFGAVVYRRLVAQEDRTLIVIRNWQDNWE